MQPDNENTDSCVMFSDMMRYCKTHQKEEWHFNDRQTK